MIRIANVSGRRPPLRCARAHECEFDNPGPDGTWPLSPCPNRGLVGGRWRTSARIWFRRRLTLTPRSPLDPPRFLSRLDRLHSPQTVDAPVQPWFNRAEGWVCLDRSSALPWLILR